MQMPTRSTIVAQPSRLPFWWIALQGRVPKSHPEPASSRASPAYFACRPTTQLLGSSTGFFSETMLVCKLSVRLLQLSLHPPARS